MNWKRLQPNKKGDPLEWDYQPPKVNDRKQAIDGMSLISGMCGDYEVTKIDNLAGIIGISGTSLDLLNDREQEDAFEDYGVLLMQTLGGGVDGSLQFLEPTAPVDMAAYLDGLKKRYLTLQKEQPVQQFKIQLLASYIDHLTQMQESKNMTTRQHLLIVKVPVRDKSMTSLKLAVTHLEEKLSQAKRDLENALTDFGLTVETLVSQEVQTILRNLINFKG